jgi:hypothetical protein
MVTERDMAESAKKQYSDKQIKKIISLALELQKEESRDGTELTLADVEAVGAELGISRDLIRRAADKVERGGAGTGWKNAIGGDPLIVHTEISDREMSEAVLNSLVSFIPTAASVNGVGQVHGNGLYWSSVSQISQNPPLQVTVKKAEGGGMELQVSENQALAAGGVFGGLLGGLGFGGGLGVGLGVGIGALGSALFASLVPLVLLGGSYLLARSIFSLLLRSRSRKLREILERLVDHVES